MSIVIHRQYSTMKIYFAVCHFRDEFVRSVCQTVLNYHLSNRTGSISCADGNDRRGGLIMTKIRRTY